MPEPLSIYIHWPFCKSKCPYCDFFKKVQKNVNQAEIIDSYLTDLEHYHRMLPDRVVRSIFFGGGTPSLLAPEQISRVLEKISRLWTLESGAEISLEANPNSEYPGMFAKLRQAGINRLSLGVQALNEKDLCRLGRTHTLKQALHSIEEVRTHFTNASMDLIYARPQQDADTWQAELQQAVSFGFQHLSLYQLTIEEGTVFAAKNVCALDEDDAAKMYVQTVNFLRVNGYPRYEVSNFATADYESKHNKCYWLGDDYIGIGESAHGRIKYQQRHYACRPPRDMEVLTDEERAEELVIMGMRLDKGINKRRFKEICGLDFSQFANRQKIAEFVRLKLVEDTPDYICATDDGFLVLNKIIEGICIK